MSGGSPGCTVWRFCDAPQEYQDLSGAGGDEDWLAFVPDGFTSDRDAEIYRDVPIGPFSRDDEDGPGSPDLPWARPGGPFGVCDVEEHRVAGGFVFIGRHA